MKILVVSPIDGDALEQLQRQHDVICAFDAKPDVIRSLLKDREALVFRSGVSLMADTLAHGPELKLLVRAGSGMDNLDLEYVQNARITLARIPEPGAKAVAELSFAFMLNLARNVLTADRLTRQGRWAKHEMTGYLLTGKTLGIMGAGNIGSRVGRLGVAWGMKVLGCVEHPNPQRAAAFLEQGIHLTDCADVLANADFVSIHVPLKASTRNLIDARALARMKPGAFLVNLARGGVVDEHALCSALTSGHLRGAALDVHQAEGEGKISPLADLPNVILTPHMGAGTFDSQREIGERIVEIVNSFHG